MILKDNPKIKNYTKRDYEQKIILGSTLDVLKKFPTNSIQTIVTSPSYFLKKQYENQKETFNDYKIIHAQIIK